VLLEHLGMLLGCSGDALGVSWVCLEPLGLLLGCSWGALADSSGALEDAFENLYGEEIALRCSWVPKA
jgi:hypothetical protein